MRATLLLCDAAQESGGKLYVLGGGWGLLHTPNVPVNMGLAIQISIPWDQANEKHMIEAKLMTDDGAQVEMEGMPVLAKAEVEVGRPPGMKPGQDIDLPLAPNFAGVVLEPGGYRWELWVNDEQLAIAPFRVADNS